MNNEEKGIFDRCALNFWCDSVLGGCFHYGSKLLAVGIWSRFTVVCDWWSRKLGFACQEQVKPPSQGYHDKIHFVRQEDYDFDRMEEPLSGCADGSQ